MALTAGALLHAGCASQEHVATAPGQPQTGPGKPDDFLVVDCLLPAQVRKLGQQMTYLAPRQAIKTSARDCEIRGGEYVAYDRANYATALKVWLPPAEQGDPAAQTYVGEIFEKGLGVPADYNAAAVWYRRAAESGYSRAAINLGNLYEQGLGVPKDPQQALNWYRKAAGLSQLTFQTVPGKTTAELRDLEAQVTDLRRQLQDKQDKLDQTQTEIAQLKQSLKQGEEDAKSLRSPTPSASAPPSAPPGPASTARPVGDEAARLAQKEREMKVLRDQIAHMEAGSGPQKQEVANVRQELDKVETDVRALRAGFQPMKVETAPDGPQITFTQVQLIERESISTRGVQATRIEIPAATRSWIVVGRVTSSAGLRSLSINERQRTPEGDNVFTVRLTGTDRHLVIVATDRRARTSTLEYRLPALATERTDPPGSTAASLTPSQLSQLTRSAGRYHALVIGNNSYRNIPQLRTAVNDAREVAQALQTQYGFQVKLLTDSTGYELLRALDDLRGKLTKEDNLLIYYAGHGKMDDAGKGYWLPVDAVASDRSSWIANEKITGLLDAMAVHQLLLVADSCYSGTLTRSVMGQPDPVKTQDEMLRILEELTQKRSRIAMTSGRLEPVLDGGGGGAHSIFAAAFLKTLRDNNGVLLGQDFFRQVQLQVADAATRLPMAPDPQYAPIHPGYEAGDFVFIRPAS
ncbi:MAG TPA: caspase family protein [Candidatus Methylomirabilis sp.]|nr:caspase family protein [Candidatus Methylomirabilis sp.]